MTTSTDRPPTQGHRPVPNITEEVDRPFSYDRCSSNTDENLSKRLEVNRELHSMSIDNFKHILSQNLLKWCIIGRHSTPLVEGNAKETARPVLA